MLSAAQATSTVPGRSPDSTPTINQMEKDFAEKVYRQQTVQQNKQKLSSDMILGKLEDWLKLLIATLKSQDPTDPVDHKDMINQFSQFAQTMGMNDIKDSIGDLKHMMSTSQAIEAAQQIDKLVKMEGCEFGLSNELLELSFDMPPEAKEAFLVITDVHNKIIKSHKAPCIPGENSYIWTGVTNDEEIALHGEYKFYVTAYDDNGQALHDVKGGPLDIKTYIKGRSQGAGVGESGPYLKINTINYPLSHLVSVDSVINLQGNTQSSPQRGADSSSQDNNSNDTF